LIFTHNCFSDALVENQILKDLSVVFHVRTPFCKRFTMDYGGFPLAARGMEKTNWRMSFLGVNWQNQAGLLQQIMYFQSGNICEIFSQHWLEGESNIFP